MASRFIWRHQYDDAADLIASAETEIVNNEPSMTQQQFAKDADLNTIIKRFGITDGAVPPAALNPEYFGDFTDSADFREHLDRVRNAADRFNALPADLRAMFNNDPVELHEWVSDPTNADEAVKLGLLQRTSEIPKDTQAARAANTDKVEREKGNNPPIGVDVIPG